MARGTVSVEVQTLDLVGMPSLNIGRGAELLRASSCKSYTRDQIYIVVQPERLTELAPGLVVAIGVGLPPFSETITMLCVWLLESISCKA